MAHFHYDAVDFSSPLQVLIIFFALFTITSFLTPFGLVTPTNRGKLQILLQEDDLIAKIVHILLMGQEGLIYFICQFHLRKFLYTFYLNLIKLSVRDLEPCNLLRLSTTLSDFLASSYVQLLGLIKFGFFHFYDLANSAIQRRFYMCVHPWGICCIYANPRNCH